MIHIYYSIISIKYTFNLKNTGKNIYKFLCRVYLDIGAAGMKYWVVRVLRVKCPKDNFT